MGSVWYIGSSTVRSISASSWADAGYPGMDATVWSEGNGWSIPQDVLSQAQLDYLALQSDFLLTAVDGPREHGTDWTPPDDTVATRAFVQEEVQQALQTAEAYADELVASGLPSVIDLGGPNDSTGA